MMGLWAACARIEPSSGPGEETNVPVWFSLNFSDISPLSMTQDDEQKIETIDVLAFVQRDGAYRFSYLREGKNYSPQGGGRFTVDLISYSRPQILVVLANARSELSASGLGTADDVETALAKIFVDSPAEWPARNIDGTDADFRVIPMTGISPAVLITEGMTEFPAPVELLRMLARVNITLAEGVDNFELKTARIFNRVTKGYAGYKASEWTLKHAWVPVDGDGKPYKTYAPAFTYRAQGLANASHITDQIYILESKGVTRSDYLQGTAIVVGGLYDSGSGVETCYYRIDLTEDGLLGDTPVDIVRPHSYNIEIQQVSFPGPKTPEGAYEGLSTLTAVVTDWNEYRSNVIADGQHYLKLSHREIILGKTGGTPVLKAETDYDAIPNLGFPAGVRLDTTGTGRWCLITKRTVASPTGVYRYEFDLSVSANPSGTAARSTSFTLSAANMNYVVKVTQDKDDWLRTNLSPSYAAGLDRYTFRVWSGQPWEIDTVADPDGILALGTTLKGLTGGRNTSDGDEVGFYLKQNAAPGKTAVLTFRDTEGLNPSLAVRINSAP